MAYEVKYLVNKVKYGTRKNQDTNVKPELFT
jgi:hypothetical protein